MGELFPVKRTLFCILLLPFESLCDVVLNSEKLCDNFEITGYSDKLDVICKGMYTNNIPQIDNSEKVDFLDLSSNTIRTLKAYSLSTYTHLSVMYIYSSGVEFVDSKAFFGLKYLKVLDLSRNSIKYISPKTFTDNPSLEKLDLSRNPLINIDTQSPILISQFLKFLNLRDCKLTFLTSESFMALPNIQELDLSGNALEKISLSVLTHLCHLRSVDLKSNPWTCDCEMKTLLNWISKRGNIHGPIRCFDNHEFRKLWSINDNFRPCYVSGIPEKIEISECTLEKLSTTWETSTLKVQDNVFDDYKSVTQRVDSKKNYTTSNNSISTETTLQLTTQKTNTQTTVFPPNIEYYTRNMLTEPKSVHNLITASLILVEKLYSTTTIPIPSTTTLRISPQKSLLFTKHLYKRIMIICILIAVLILLLIMAIMLVVNMFLSYLQERVWNL